MLRVDIYIFSYQGYDSGCGFHWPFIALAGRKDPYADKIIPLA